MTKGSYPYPEDEFDAEPASDAPVGVHRAPRTWWSRWWPFVAVLVVVPVVTVSAVLWASSQNGGSGNDQADDPTVQQTTQAADDTGEVDPGTDDTGADDGTDPAEDATAEPETPDYATPVQVLNAARVNQLAATTAAKLEAAGFTQVEPGNGDATAASVTTVFYASADLATTARAVADVLGITEVVESAQQSPTGITVLLLAGYAS